MAEHDRTHFDGPGQWYAHAAKDQRATDRRATTGGAHPRSEGRREPPFGPKTPSGASDVDRRDKRRR